MTDFPALPQLETILFERRGRLLVMTLNRPEAMNAVNLQLHDDLLDAMWFAQGDAGSDVILLTGAGRAFSAGGDIDHIERSATHPHLFDHEARIAKRIVFTMLDIDKPIVCRMNGHAVGLGATLALLSDVIFAGEKAKIGDPHVGIGLVAGDGGAILWAQRIGLARAKEFLFTGDLLAAPRAVEIGLINHALPLEELDAAVDAFCAKLLAQPMPALRATKMLTNLETKRIAHALMDAGIAYESLSVRSEEHRAAVAALKARITK
ncbi:MAG: enoyl-CoA hydratase/isomerase family protein [Sphingomonadales bacterium]|nr:enoyl-CoA hydratase/isomerase family protein [Sphingomonadales bacterium]